MRIDEVTKDLEKNIDVVLRPPNYRKITSAKVPTWATSDGLEGLEIVDGKILNFWFENGTRNYEKAGNIVFEEIKRNYTPKRPEQRIEQVPVKQASEENKNVMMPEKLTKSLMDKSTFEETFLNFQHTAKEYVKKRKGRGGDYSFVEGWYMKQVMNLATKWRWSSHIEGWIRSETEVICWGSVAIHAENGDVLCAQSAVGQADIKFKKDSKEILCLGDDYKAAATDMIKKAISQWGIASDVYRGEV